MPRIDDIARGVLAAIASDANLLLAGQWVADRYIQLCGRARFEHLREVGELVIPASITTGTITVAVGSKTVTGDSDASAAWSAAIRGRHILLNNIWHEIVEVSGATITLRSEYTGDAITAGAYTIVPRYVTIDNVRTVGEFRHSRRNMPLDKRSDILVDATDPQRLLVSDGPTTVSEIGVAKDSGSGAGLSRRFEFYPYCRDAEMIHYVYYANPPRLKLGDYVPDSVDEYILREGALIDHMRYKMAKATDAGQIEQAAIWRNEYRTQESSWEKKIPLAIRADKSSDDQTFIMHKITSGGGSPTRDITTARDQVWSR